MSQKERVSTVPSGISVKFEFMLPSIEYESSYGAYIRELGDEVRHPFPLDFDHSDFASLLGRLESFAKGTNLPSGFVPASTYWLVQGSELVGVSNLRHYLNDRLKADGGHIGLGIRPSYRRRGLGSLLLGLTILEAGKKGIAQIHVHCHKGNIASARAIVRNGGVLDSEVLDPDSGVITQRYQISSAP